MNYTEWPFIEAQRIKERLDRLGKTNVVAQTGYGPSGLPHIGTFGEVARTSFVLKALEIIAPEIDRHLIAFSDDMDGLREAPKNIPNRDMVIEHLGKPLTSVPDPFGEEKSFAHNMNRKLQEFLNSFGFEYEFASSTEKYSAGAFNDGLKRVMNNNQKIIELFTKTISEDKRAAWSPFFPVCENCGKIYSTRVTNHDTENYKVSYVCDSSLEGKYTACGHTGEVSIFDGTLKLGWKVDWALRWFSLGVDYEMHGEDLMESGRLSKKLVRVIGGKPPELFKYELFLDEDGKKISKKIGNGVSIDQWLSYGPVDSLLYFMYIKPQQTKKMGLPLLPKIIDQYLELVAKYDGETVDSPVTFITRLSKGAHAVAMGDDKAVNYSMIYNLVLALNETDPAIVREYLLKYQPKIAENMEYFNQLIAEVLKYYKEVYLARKVDEEPSRDYDEAILAFCEELEKLKNAGDKPEADVIQNMSFRAAKERDINMKQWFKTLYLVFLKQSSGPKIGSFVVLLGLDKSIERLKTHLGKAPAK